MKKIIKPLSEKELLKQTSLSPERLNKYLTPKKDFTFKHKRPESSLIELINWATNELCIDPQQHGSYIHNKIVIDGNFIQFCEDNKVKVECLFKDSIASWKTEGACEDFIAQGAFRITRGDLSFIHCSLFHKGNQNEDEVSFFVLVKNDSFQNYIELRNEFDNWKTEREKFSQEIYVVGGESIAYETDIKWDDLIISEKLQEEIKISVEGFLNAESFYKDNGIPWKRGMIFWGEPGCGKTLAIKIILSQYGFKPVTIQPGHPQKDQLLNEAFSYASSHGPSLLFLEDLPELIVGADLSHFLQLLDGFSSKEGLMVIATANDLSSIPANITDRPSRFDRKIMFPAPNKQTAMAYLKSKFKNILTQKQYDVIVAKSVKNNFSFAYLKEIFVTSAHIAISDNRKIQKYSDVEAAMAYLLSDKGYVKRGFGLISPIMDMANYFEDDGDNNE